jgi:hypothetical protein
MGSPIHQYDFTTTDGVGGTRTAWKEQWVCQLSVKTPIPVIIPDDPSDRVMKMSILSKRDEERLGLNDRIIFGTGDRQGIKTVTLDDRFVKAAKYKGVRIDYVLFPSVRYAGK